MNYKKSVYISVFTLAAFSFQSCSNSNPETTLTNEKPIIVTLGSFDKQYSGGDIDVTGQVEAAHSTNIATRIMGYITKVYVKTGDQVKAGQLLFTVNSADILAKKGQTAAMLSQAEAALHVAQKDYDRYNTLYKQNSASAKELEQITLQYQSAKANVDAAKSMQNEVNAQLTYTNVVAPFSGVITQKLAEEGSLANPGMPIVTIEQGGSLQVSALVPENQIAAIKIGDEASMEVTAANKQFKGKIIQINPSSQFTGGQYIIKAAIPSAETKQLFAGMYVKIKIISKVAAALSTKDTISNTVFIPTAALVYRDQLVGVYTIGSQNTALLRWIRVGKQQGDKMEILSGLSKNESFILSSETSLYNGAPVSIK